METISFEFPKSLKDLWRSETVGEYQLAKFQLIFFSFSSLGFFFSGRIAKWILKESQGLVWGYPMESFGLKMKKSIPRWWKKRFSATITETDPSCKVVYLGNVLTGWAKGKQQENLATLTSHLKIDLASNTKSFKMLRAAEIWPNGSDPLHLFDSWLIYFVGFLLNSVIFDINCTS